MKSWTVCLVFLWVPMAQAQGVIFDPDISPPQPMLRYYIPAAVAPTNQVTHVERYYFGSPPASKSLYVPPTANGAAPPVDPDVLQGRFPRYGRVIIREYYIWDAPKPVATPSAPPSSTDQGPKPDPLRIPSAQEALPKSAENAKSTKDAEKMKDEKAEVPKSFPSLRGDASDTKSETKKEAKPGTD